MWFQIVDVLIKLVGAFGKGQKLSIAKKKANIGSKLVELHQIISRLQRNAILIENLLKETTEKSDDGKNYYLSSNKLHQLFSQQLYELDLLKSSLNDDIVSAIIDIYDQGVEPNNLDLSLGYAVKELADYKISLIEFLSCIVEGNIDRFMLPTSFDLMDIKEFRAAKYETAPEYQDFLFLLAFGDEMLANSPFFMEFPLFPTRDANDSKSNYEIDEKWVTLKKQTKILFEQAIEQKTSARLAKVRNDMSTLIRTNFSIEDII